MSVKNLIEKLSERKDLDAIDCQDFVNGLLSPEAEPLQSAALLALLHAKGESVREIYHITKAIRKTAKPACKPKSKKILDIVGSGGDGANTINISTGSAILSASCGIKIGKHGNRSVSSLSGSADILEALGINIHQESQKIADSIDHLGIGFYYAPDFYPAMQALKTIRKKLNVPTIFNILGPLLNPINPDYLILGAKNKTLQKSIAEVLALPEFNCQHALVVHSQGLDEISCIGKTDVIEVKNKSLHTFVIDPKDYGFSYCTLTDLKGDDAKHNAKLLIDAFGNPNSPIAQTLILNCATALWLTEKSKTIHEGIEKAQEALQSGNALSLLNQWRKVS